MTLKSCLASLISRRGGPRHGPPPPPTLGRAPTEPWRASGLTPDVSSPGSAAKGRQLYGVEDLGVAGAAAEVAGQGFLDLLPRGTRYLLQQGLGSQQDPRCAVAALRGAQLGE